MNPAPNLASVNLLIGVWKGPGRGTYPTITPFEYTEEVTFSDVGKPFLVYRQRTFSNTGAPMHTESGFLRVPSVGVSEFVLAQPTGQTELLEGTIETLDRGLRLWLTSRQVVNSTSAKQVDATQREYILRGDTMTTEFSMAAVDQQMSRHLFSTLEAVPSVLE